ncbi:hypothetical protein GP475_08880 [Corynebacterium poyangense]|uniref:YqaJ viral recombinase domain-containing protein n=1 Tax=Corynebacterium poyangense TaxID=2684405 RepID=A0A7H0SQB5_9CORY|nr:YqaJ viral recombinase family protein [Corynebacterium poyangense]QNQ90740.1 hypothetical protein GP475_08880 [Corynebacterium poyangense]
MTQPPERLYINKRPAKPGSKEWREMITASKVPGIAGMSHYTTPYRIWHEMNGLEPPEPSEQLEDRWATGHAMEEALATYYKIKNPEITLSRGEVQCFHPDMGGKYAASLDRIATPKGKARGPKNSWNVQFKTVSDWEQYKDLDLDTLPPEWVVQVTWEMHISGLIHHPTQIMVAGPYYDWKIIEISYDAEFAEGLERRVCEFEHSLSGEAPEPSSPADAAIARKAYPELEPNTDTEIPDELAESFLEAKKEAAEAGRAKREADGKANALAAKVLDLAKNTETISTPSMGVIAKRSMTKRGIQLRMTTK